MCEEAKALKQNEKDVEKSRHELDLAPDNALLT